MTNRGGRPSTYPETEEGRQELCDTVVALGSEGLSPVQISARIGIPRTTMDSWAAKHDEFSEALTRAKELEQVWWETQGQNALNDKDFHANLWIKSMQARFRHDYTERKQVDHGVQDSLADLMKELDGGNGRIPTEGES